MTKQLLLFPEFQSDTGTVDDMGALELRRKRNKEYYNRRKRDGLKKICSLADRIVSSSPVVPEVKPYAIESLPDELLPYNVWRYSQSKFKGVHFYIYDYLFTDIVSPSTSILADLRKAQLVVTPDFSQYSNMNAHQRLYNSLLNRSIAAWLQQQGINIIMNVTWSLPDSYEYCFDGLPKSCTIAVNSMGVQKYAASKYLWRKGYEEAVKRLNPSLILRYGPKMPGEYQDISVYYENVHLKRMRHGR